MHSLRINKSHRKRYSPDRDDHRDYEEHCRIRKHERRKSEGSSTDREEKSRFSFEKFRNELKRILLEIGNLVNDIEDFWKFLRKYETMEERVKISVSDQNTLNSIGVPSTFNNIYTLNFTLNRDKLKLFERVPHSSELTSEKINKFKDIIMMYIGFKQKEKFEKLRKIRNEQANLPVARYQQEIVDSVRSERVVIIAGDTGCGKSTQVPRYLYLAGYLRIACTQPRRIACISLAKRVAYETLTENYNQVGYQIRFEKQRNRGTKITFITEGLLLRQVSGESGLSQYDVIILDEIHERHLHGDFLLGIAKCLIHQRPDLKLVLMSATINIKLFSQYFERENVKMIQIPGRLYPIKLVYRPITVDDKRYKNERFNPSPYVQIMQLIDQKYSSAEKGDLLIFLSGMSEISAVVEAAKDYSLKKNNWIVLPLHSTLSVAEQDKVFGYPPDGVRKCIVSTNIAETSITIDGVRFVADSGKVKEMSYDPSCKMQRLKEFWISKASAEQRKGRAGRTGPGVCYRMYSEEDYAKLENYSTPEIQRVPLDSLLLQMIAMGLSDPRKFPFLESPPAASIENSILSLKEHGAITENERLTSIGKTLARLPVDLSIGQMLIMGSIFHQVEPILSLAAALSVQNPITNATQRNVECENSRKELESDHGDPVTILNAFRAWLEIKQETSFEQRYGGGKSKTWCRRRGLEEQRFYEITKLRAQFKELLQDCNLLRDSSRNDTPLSGTERALRYGELKLLKNLKREYRQNETRSRKQLKLDSFDLEMQDESREIGEIDIKDVEFRMKNDSSQVQNLLTATTACSYKDLMMIKLILCSGLYPQFAIADEYNYCKSVSEQLFHTKVKPFVGLHPTSFFGNHPQVLQLEQSEIVSIPGFKSKLPLSAKHQLLAYMSLLETTKPYLVNTLRMPAAQTLFIFAQEIDTDATLSSYICDSWLLLEFPIPNTGQTLLLKATKLREIWDSLLNQRLQESMKSEDAKQEDFMEIETKLVKELIEYMHTSVAYTIKRLLPADLKSLYRGSGLGILAVDPNPFSKDFQVTPHELKGGIRLTNYITFNCLRDNEWSTRQLVEMSENEWECPSCGEKAIFTAIERLQHSSSCMKKGMNERNTEKVSNSTFRKPNSIAFDCSICGKTLHLTPIEVLKHKKEHK